MIRKISVKTKSPSYTHLNHPVAETKSTSKFDIAETLGETFLNNSCSRNYSEKFQKIKAEQEKLNLISEYNPSVFCFQETFLKPDDKISLKGFNIYNYVHTDCLRPSGGASIFVKSSFPQRKIDLQTELQATAISVTLDREITIYFVYIPPSFSLKSQHLDNLLQQLPSPYILLGDFNGHNILWGGQNNDSRGELVENFITRMTYVL